MNTANLRFAVCYAAALQTIAPLPRAVFLLRRVDDFSYREIGMRLAIKPAVVEDCIAFALTTFMVLWQGELPDRPTPMNIAEAEAFLFQKYRKYCANFIVDTKSVTQETFNISPNNQQNLSVDQSCRELSLRMAKLFFGTFLHYLKPPFISSAMTFDEWLRMQTDTEHNLELATSVFP